MLEGKYIEQYSIFMVDGGFYWPAFQKQTLLKDYSCVSPMCECWTRTRILEDRILKFGIL